MRRLTYERYAELLSCAPSCTADELAALKSFIPRLTPISASVRTALMQCGLVCRAE